MYVKSVGALPWKWEWDENAASGNVIILIQTHAYEFAYYLHVQTCSIAI